MEHTKEPWNAARRAIAGTVDVYVGDYLNGRIERIADVVCVENARRIVACVNACKGMTNDQLDNICTISGNLLNRFGEQMHYLGQVEKQRDELLAALKEVANTPRSRLMPHHRIADKAIAKAEAS